MIAYRRLDGSTVLPDGTVISKYGARSAPGASPYPPPAEIGGLHPITLPDEPAKSAGIEATVPASSKPAAITPEDRIRELEAALEGQFEQHVAERKRTIVVGIVAVLGLVTAGVLAAKRM